MCAEKRPNAKDVMDNLNKPMPLGMKFGLPARNSLIKITNLRSCCGHPGEPGW